MAIAEDMFKIVEELYTSTALNIITMKIVQVQCSLSSSIIYCISLSLIVNVYVGCTTSILHFIQLLRIPNSNQIKVSDHVTVCEKERKKEECQTSFKVDVNKMPVQPIHDVMSTGHAINGTRLLIPLEVDTIVTK